MLFISLAVLLATDTLFAVALGAARFYRTPEETMSYPVYIKRVFRHSRPFFLWAPSRRYARKARITRHYALYTCCGWSISAAVYAVFADETVGRIIAAMAAGWLLQAMCYVDMRTRYLPDIFMLPALALSIGVAASGLYLPTADAFIGGAAGFALMWSINALFKLIRRKDGMGGGDFILTGLLGLWTGVWALPYILFLSSFAGLTGACMYALCMRKGMPERFAYGPALALSGWGIFLAMQTPAGRALFPL